MQPINSNPKLLKDYQGIICLCGNDGTGKSTITRLFNQKYPAYLILERSSYRSQEQKVFIPSPSTQVMKIVKQIKNIDKLTFKYSFQQERQTYKTSDFIQFQIENKEVKKIPIYWIMLQCKLSQIFKRVNRRDQLTIYESQKCIKYFDEVYREMAYSWGIPIVRNDGILTPAQVVDQIQNLITKKQQNKKTGYQLTKQFKLQDITYEKTEQLDIQQIIFNKISKQQSIIIYQNQIKKKMKKDQPYLYHFYYNQLENYQKDQALIKKLACRWIVRNGIISKNLQSISFFLTQFENQNQSVKKVISLSKPNKQEEFHEIILYRSVQGQSKIIYSILCDKQQYPHFHSQFSDKILILLKSTIYSHKMQHTGQIKNLGSIRAQGSMLFLQMIRRNQLKHAYICLNKKGIILSQRINNINKLEIVFKKYCIGTDKHSYHGITNSKLGQIVSKPKIQDVQESDDSYMIENQIINPQTNQYKSQIYIRYDWRNPNHFLKDEPSYILNANPYYYLIQAHLKKENFFQKFLTNKQQCIPMGDKCITKDILQKYVNQNIINKTILRLYCTMAYYLDQVGLQLIDGCSMIQDKQGIIWSQINPDCLRVKKIDKQNSQQSKDYDKDIWRKGGSSAKVDIVKKWSLFNEMVRQYFIKNRFHEGQLWEIGQYPYQITASKLQQQSPENPYNLILQSFIRGNFNKKRQIIATIDLKDGKPTLVKSSLVSQSHSNNIMKCYEYLSVFNKVVMVNLDGAFDDSNSLQNSQIIKDYSLTKNNNLFGTGGGIRNKNIVQYYKQSKIKNLIVSTNLDIIDQIKDQSDQFSCNPIVQLSINQKNQILTHGRTINTHVDVIIKLRELVQQKKIKTVSITFVQTQGHLSGIPKQQIKQLMVQIPGQIQKVIIAGGITTIQDLQFLWNFDKCIPQLGAAIWKKTIMPSQIIAKIIRWKQITNQGYLICPAIVYDSNSDAIIGQVFMNKEALIKTVDQRILWRYSRQHKKVMMKGETSGNIMKIEWLRIDCDQDCILVGVKSEGNKQFCHLNQKSCFQMNTQKKASIHTFQTLQKHIQSRKNSGGYSEKMQNNSGLAYLKLFEEIQQMQISKDQQHLNKQCADVIAHLIMYMNSRNISTEDVFKELSQRSKLPKIKVQNKNQQIIQAPAMFMQSSSASQSRFTIGIVSGKHLNFCDQFCQNILGVKIYRGKKNSDQKNRSLQIHHEIIDKSKIGQFIQQSQLSFFNFLGVKSKDIPLAMSKGIIKYCVNYSIMMQNWPVVSKCLIKQKKSHGIKLALIKRANQVINPKQWNNKKKGMIASEYPVSVTKYLTQMMGIKEDCFSIFKVSGCSQSYLKINKFDYCDAIVVTGNTLKDNNLQIEAVLDNQVSIGLYEIL